MKKDSCQFCKAIYPDEIGQIISEGGISICKDCWDRLLREKLTAKEYARRIK